MSWTEERIDRLKKMSTRFRPASHFGEALADLHVAGGIGGAPNRTSSSSSPVKAGEEKEAKKSAPAPRRQSLGAQTDATKTALVASPCSPNPGACCSLRSYRSITWAVYSLCPGEQWASIPPASAPAGPGPSPKPPQDSLLDLNDWICKGRSATPVSRTLFLRPAG
jgi:hypothetical protein